MRRRLVMAGLAAIPLLARAEGLQTFPPSELEGCMNHPTGSTIAVTIPR